MKEFVLSKIESVKPDETDRKMLKEIDSDSDTEYISLEETIRKLSLINTNLKKNPNSIDR